MKLTLTEIETAIAQYVHANSTSLDGNTIEQDPGMLKVFEDAQWTLKEYRDAIVLRRMSEPLTIAMHNFLNTAPDEEVTGLIDIVRETMSDVETVAYFWEEYNYDISKRLL